MCLCFVHAQIDIALRYYFFSYKVLTDNASTHSNVWAAMLFDSSNKINLSSSIYVHRLLMSRYYVCMVDCHQK